MLRPIHFFIGCGPLLFAPTLCHATQPRIFFSDLESGPNSGGENNAGLYVTIHGKNFGAARGTSSVTIGGGGAAAYPIWTDTKITFQLGAPAATGDIVIQTPSGKSNSVPFTVRPGKIYFVATTGGDSNPGTFSRPWRTIQHAIDKIGPGDTIYVKNDVTEAKPGTSDGSVRITTSGRAGAPKALVAYPGATATIGAAGTGSCNTTTCIEGLGTYKVDASYHWWVISGLQLKGNNIAMWITGRNSEPSTNWRVIGNEITCPNGNGPTGCFETSQTHQVAFYGNNVHHTGQTGASALYHGVYFSTDSNHIDMGWNTVAYVNGCRGVQFHSSALGPGGPRDPTGHNQFDLSVHDNLIHDTQCDGVIFATVDPSKGKVEAYNNVIYRAGKGPATPEGGGNFSCIYAAGTTNNGQAGGGTVQIYNNTMYDCGAMKPASSGAVQNGGHNPALLIRMLNNIIYQPRGQAYITSWNKTGHSVTDGRGTIVGSNNMFFGNGNPPAGFTRSLNSDPLFVDQSKHDFHLRGGTPARCAGISTNLSRDKDGVTRGGNSGYDVGAFQLLGAAPISCPPSS